MLRPILWAIAFILLQLCARGLLGLDVSFFGKMPWWKDVMLMAIAGVCMWFAMRIEKNNS